MLRIIPSIASARMLSVKSLLHELGGCGSLHIDIEDGNFVPNITFGMKMVREIAAAANLPLNVHLMVTDPMRYILPLAECGATEIAVHIESVPYPMQVLRQIQSCGMAAGLAFNFATLVQNAAAFADEVDFLMLMTAEEDGVGQVFRPSCLGRIRAARELLPPGKSVWVDGGIGERELPLVGAAGADTVIMGRAVVQSENPRESLAYFSQLA